MCKSWSSSAPAVWLCSGNPLEAQQKHSITFAHTLCAASERAERSDSMTTQRQEQDKRYDPADSTLKFVTRQDDISKFTHCAAEMNYSSIKLFSPQRQLGSQGARRTLDDDPDTLRAEMSCGHAVTPQSLTAWCRSLLDQGQYVFRCPALKDGTVQKCEAQWSYQEVRKLAVLTAAEQQHFEETMAALAAAEYCEFKSCPGCHTCVEREDISNLNVHCTVCSAVTAQAFEFCWQCLRVWKGPGPRSDRCGNDGCTNKDLELLKGCPTTSLPQVQNLDPCPSIRACPTCGLLLEHDRTGCKNILCSRCQVEFCFVCLKLTPACLQTSSYFLPCSDGVAPRQEAIPSWKRS
ncbi:hypothetical protein JZ751_022525 [Albula glossodonta]|uniref:RING-type domain-containing protein n=1 Tax=Albula glossodonta TaxID=121402 RepID=A0A8T2MRE9_9TELE|nr:hypothetical protein JZ751_022525 [Albula glossodonta]